MFSIPQRVAPILPILTAPCIFLFVVVVKINIGRGSSALLLEHPATCVTYLPRCFAGLDSGIEVFQLSLWLFYCSSLILHFVSWILLHCTQDRQFSRPTMNPN